MHQFEQRANFNCSVSNEHLYRSLPKLSYEIYLKIFGVLSYDIKLGERVEDFTKKKKSFGVLQMYGVIICLFLWLFALRIFVLILVQDESIQYTLGDLTHFWESYRLYFLIPQFFFGLHAALVSAHFIFHTNNEAWLIPFVLSSHQHNSGLKKKPSLLKYKNRIRFYTLFSIFIICLKISENLYTYYIAFEDPVIHSKFKNFFPWVVLHIIWVFYCCGIIMFTMSYFNLMCKEVEKQFSYVSKSIEELAESEPGPPGSKDEDLISLYFAHNELCELVDESNSYWNLYLFYAAILNIPCFYYVLYVLFFAALNKILLIHLISTFTYSFIILAIISTSAAKVSSEAHEPYTSLHTLSLLQLPIDLEVNMSTFLHRIRGPTIGYSCLDLFVITDASISSTLAAATSYFLIVADFSRSTIGQNLALANQRAMNTTTASNS